ncbi:hypothetical protein ACS5PK_02965 [Roseateles sp. DB2]|uniref:hypothetical protein n=1 Tax=Roseateles sp. DB2 TaxID=3453717 RepID=UPI003EEB5541
MLDIDEIGCIAGGTDPAGACLTANNGVQVCQFADGSKVAVICDSRTTFNVQVALDILNWNKSRGGGGSAGMSYQTESFNCTVVEISSAADLGKGNKTRPK